MTTTFKAFALTVMMACCTGTVFANTNAQHDPHRNNKPTPPPPPAAQHIHKDNKYRPDCHCPKCEDFRRKEMERMHRDARGPVRDCHCPKCEDMRRHQGPQQAPPPPGKPNNGHPGNNGNHNGNHNGNPGNHNGNPSHRH